MKFCGSIASARCTLAQAYMHHDLTHTTRPEAPGLLRGLHLSSQHGNASTGANMPAAVYILKPACTCGYGTCRVWYIARDGARLAATVVSVDISHPPPFYGIRMSGSDSVRETEGHRLAAFTATELAELESEEVVQRDSHPAADAGK